MPRWEGLIGPLEGPESGGGPQGYPTEGPSRGKAEGVAGGSPWPVWGRWTLPWSCETQVLRWGICVGNPLSSDDAIPPRYETGEGPRAHTQCP